MAGCCADNDKPQDSTSAKNFLNGCVTVNCKKGTLTGIYVWNCLLSIHLSKYKVLPALFLQCVWSFKGAYLQVAGVGHVITPISSDR
jgi:hypothetical protein